MAKTLNPTAPRGPLAGKDGEDLACRFLEDRGYRVEDRNFRCRSGEVDVVARSPEGTIVFVEVKDRSGTSHGHGFDAVTAGKRQRVVRAARYYAALRGLMDASLRFDVVSIDRSLGVPRVRHDEDAFDSDGA